MRTPISRRVAHAMSGTPLLCYRCGSRELVYRHCKVFCRHCGALVENCGGDRHDAASPGPHSAGRL